jgi:hypothetical protein
LWQVGAPSFVQQYNGTPVLLASSSLMNSKRPGISKVPTAHVLGSSRREILSHFFEQGTTLTIAVTHAACMI